MDDSFKIPIDYKGEEQEFDAKLVSYGYTHRFVVDIEGAEVYFEPDEGGEYRAILPGNDFMETKSPNIEVIKLVTQVLDKLRG